MSIMSKKIKVPKPTKAYGFTGVWQDESVGWCGLSHIGGTREYPDYPEISEDRRLSINGQRLLLCEVTLTPVLDKKGRPITRIVRG